MYKLIRKNNRLQIPGIYNGGQYYFITILVRERACVFEIDTSDAYSQIIKNELQNIEKFYKGTRLDAFVIMPNHIHAVLAINQNSKTSLSQIISTFKSITYKKIKMLANNVTESPSFPPGDNTEIKSNFGETAKSGNVGVAVTIQKLIQNYNTIWHKSYHDHIIREESELLAIRKYIQDNPTSWELDELHPKATP
jgi:putative transposase